MLASLAPLIPLLVSILGILLKTWVDGKPKREEKKEEKKEQENRNVLEKGDVNSLMSRVDKLLPVSESSDNSKPLSSTEDDERRLREFLGISNDK